MTDRWTPANTRKHNAAVLRECEKNTKYDLYCSIALDEEQTMDDVETFLNQKLSNKFVDRTLIGAGTCLITGLRDYHFNGNREDVNKIVKCLVNQGTFVLNHIGFCTEDH